MKNLVSFLLLFVVSFCGAQQAPEFKEVTQYFDYQRKMLNNEFKKRFDAESNAANKVAIQKDFQEFMLKLDSIQNNAFVNTLVKVKIREDLERLHFSEISEENNPARKDLTRDAYYAGGFGLLRQQISELFYTGAVLAHDKEVRTKLLFVVEKDGSISSVKAEGDNFTFNRQAEIALYLLPGKFAPAYLQGSAVRYRFSLPLTINFEQ